MLYERYATVLLMIEFGSIDKAITSPERVHRLAQPCGDRVHSTMRVLTHRAFFV